MLTLWRARLVGRFLSHMLQRAMYIDEQWLQIILERNIIVSAAQSATFAEISESNAAYWTSFLVSRRKLLRSLFDFQLFGQHARERRRRRSGPLVGQKRPRVFLAKVQRAGAVRLGKFSYMEGRWFFAVLALHLGFSRVLGRGKLLHW